MVSLKDIAKELNVSVATVSKALNGASDISAARREQISAKAREMGYFPNAMAIALKTNRTYNIGVLFADEADNGLEHDFFASILDSFKRKVEAEGYDITFINGSKEGRHGRTLLEHCRYRAFDGVLAACTNYETDEMRELAGSNIPFVSIDYAYEGRSAVISDNEDGMRQLVKYAIRRGHKKIAYIHGEDSPVNNARLGAFYDEMKKAGLEVPSNYVKGGRYRDTNLSEICTEHLLSMAEKPDCILYPDDYAALGGVNALMLRHINIYDDIEVIGYDGVLYKKGLPAKITTIIQDTFRIGLTAAELLLENMKNPGFNKVVNVKGLLLEHEKIM